MQSELTMCGGRPQDAAFFCRFLSEWRKVEIKHCEQEEKKDGESQAPNGNLLAQAKRIAALEEIDRTLRTPPQATQLFETVEKVRERFAPPVTLGVSEKERLAQDEALSDAGFYGAIHRSLQQHGYELGQYPVTSFVGYGALQQIAQNGMIRACVQTVADDITREWITITGDDAEAVEEIQTLQEKKYHLRKLFHEAATLTGYMGGAFIYVDTGTENPELPLRYSNESAELQPGKKLRFVVVDPVNVSPATTTPSTRSSPTTSSPATSGCWERRCMSRACLGFLTIRRRRFCDRHTTSSAFRRLRSSGTT